MFEALEQQPFRDIMCNLSICYWSAKFHSWSVLYELYSKLLEVPHQRNESCHKRGVHVISLTFLKLSPWFLATDQDGLDPILSCLVHISLCVWPRKEICFRKPDCDCGTSGARKGAPWLAKPGSVKLRRSRQLCEHEGKQNISGIRPFCRHFGRPCGPRNAF